MAELNTEEAISPIPKDHKNKMMIETVKKVAERQNKQVDYHSENVNNIKSAFVVCDDEADANQFFNELRKSQTQIINEYIENEMDEDPGRFDRSLVFESEIRENILILRWDG